MRLNPKKIIVLLATGFIAFAPPGTLIFLALILFGLFGKIGLAVITIITITVSVYLIAKRKNKNTSKPETAE